MSNISSSYKGSQSYRKILAFLLSLLLIAVIAVLILNRDRKAVSDDEFDGIIFVGEKSAELLGVTLINDQAKGAYWTPSKAVVRELESKLVIHVSEHSPEISQILETYRRQYFGFVREGIKMIYVVGFCRPGNVDWQNVLVSYPVSMQCYFEVQYDVEQGAIVTFWERTD